MTTKLTGGTMEPRDEEDAALAERSAAWWRRTRGDAAALCAWLLLQHRGEVTAAGRILLLRDRFAGSGRAARLLTTIAAQERRHAAWVAGLLTARGVLVPESDQEAAHGRYWAQTLPGVTDLATGAAIGAHAERMRLWRIQAIAQDDAAPADIRTVFQRILPEERFHERAFRSLSDDAALRATAGAHERGLQVLGLSA